MKHFLLSVLLLGAVTLAAQTTPTATLTLDADSPNTLTDGGTLTFTASASAYPADTSAIAWAVTVPAGWSYLDGNREPQVAPATGATLLLEWAYLDVPASSASFTFEVSYPGDILADTQVSAQVIVRTASTPTATVLPVDALAFEPAPSRDNTIDFPAIADQQGNSPSFELAATSPSGQPISYTVLSGPALISGNTVTLTGATGEVIIRADEPGDLYFLPANSATQSFNVTQAGPLVYFGTASDGSDFAVNIPEGSSTGTLLGRLPNGQFYILTFRVEENRTVTARALQLLGEPGPAALALARTSLRSRVAAGQASTAEAAAELEYTFTGTIRNGQLDFQIVELGVTLTAKVEPADGPTAEIAGLYEASSLNSASGVISSIVGTTNKVYVLVVTPEIVSGAAGTIAGNGTFTLSTAQNVTIRGGVDQPSTKVGGTILLPGGAEDAFEGLALGTARTDRLINLSTRAYVDSAGGGTLVTGFVIAGPHPKHVLLRAVGPTLGNFGVSNLLADPRVVIYDATGAVVTQVDNWGGTANLTAVHSLVGAFPLPAGSADASALVTLAPGAYTMHVASNGGAGVALAEIYDAAENPYSEYQRLVNISSRGEVNGAEGVLVAGFIVTGNSPKRVLIRGVGPALVDYGVSGVISDPRILLYNADEQIIARNDNWGTADPVFAGQRTASADEIELTNDTVGAFALGAGSADAAMLITLAPGAYTVHLDTTTPGLTGNALIEIYEVLD